MYKQFHAEPATRQEEPRHSHWWIRIIFVISVVVLSFAVLSKKAEAITFADSQFVSETVATLPPFTPVGLAFAPDGRIFVWQKSGIVRIVKNGALLTTPFIDIQSKVNQCTDRGLLGLALDPNFATNR